MIEGDISKGYTLKHYSINRYAMLLPIPDRLKEFTSISNSKFNYVEIENLLPIEYIEKNPKFENPIKDIYVLKKDHKKDFWKELLTLDKEYFIDFGPLLRHIENIFN